uniref:Lymphocyte antigen 6 family member H n=1 Tax=Molossus molossus TaxID=27622 RepID=A0A7J8BAY1_MOLMO|nr:lymphocyte antigen 6 family member H [Molossus molossus]
MPAPQRTPARSPRVFARPARSMLPAAMKGLGLVLLAALLCSAPGRKDHSVNRMCASSCDFVKRHFFSDYLMGFINSGILKVDVDCCEKDLCNRASGAGGSPWALAGGLLLSLGPTLLRAGP